MMYNNIQALRAIAAIMVFFHHLLPHYQAANGSSQIFAAIAHWGFIGVDIFFVISGFVIAKTVFTKERNIYAGIVFIKHRFLRVYTAYLPVMLIAFIILYWSESPRLAQIDIFKSITLTTSDMYLHILPVAWSLAYEMYFYLIFSLFFLLNNSSLKKVMIVLFLLVYLRTLFYPISNSSIFSFLMSGALIEFFSGVLIFIYHDFLNKKFILPLSIVIIISCIVYGVEHNIRSGDLKFIVFGLAGAFVVILALFLENNHQITVSGMLVKLGNSSYSLYLFHLILISLLYFSGIRDFLKMQPQIIIELGFVVFGLFTIAFSHFMHVYFEKPIYNFFKR